MVDRIGQQLGNYRLTRLLGRGGFAEVYLGEHLRLKTQAAIKVLHTQLADSDVDDFLREAQFIANLEHPHIVRILDFDVEDATPFLVMSYAPHGTLRQLHPKDTILPLSTVINYVKQIADALQYAHDEKLIHRDIKPENMLIGRRNEILLSDFGIALVAQSSRYQSTQEMAGTMAYMPPEQIQGKPRSASDQYALGITVYEWLTGDRPFHGSAIEIVTQHLAVPPAPLREKVPTLSRDVEQAVLIALAKDPKDRFSSIKAFANALEQADQTNVATFVRSGGPVSEPPRVEMSSKPAATPLFPPTELIVPVAKSTITPPLPSTEPAMHKQLVEAPIYIYRDHSDSVTEVAWSPDGRYIASASSDKTVHVWDLATHNRVYTHRGHTLAVKAVAWSPDGRYIVSAGDDQAAQVWNSATGSIKCVYDSELGWWAWVRSVMWAPDGRYIASGGEDKIVSVWETVPRGKVFTYRNHGRPITSITWSPNSKYIASGSDDKTVHVWDTSTGQTLHIYRGHTNTVFAVAWSPNGRHIASAGYDTIVKVWESVTGSNVFSYQGHSKVVKALTWSPDGKRIASGGDDATVQVWNVTKDGMAHVYRGHSGTINSVSWSPDGKYIASAGHDRTVQVWVAP